MKETINANIGSLAFTLDRDAYEELKAYFADIRRRKCSAASCAARARTAR